ncbi:hypothetical protein J6590_067348 [Homalodisca vitripennis]|nr:hypothetical protein J6590_067348 [Homalodisca vitripennis]
MKLCIHTVDSEYEMKAEHDLRLEKGEERLLKRGFALQQECLPEIKNESTFPSITTDQKSEDRLLLLLISRPRRTGLSEIITN